MKVAALSGALESDEARHRACRKWYSRKMPNSAGNGESYFHEDVGSDREADVLVRSIELIERSLPETWDLRRSFDAKPGVVRFDALITLAAPDGTSALLAVEAKRLIATRDVSNLVDQLRERIRLADVPNAVPMVVARYLAPSTRERLERDDVAFADATGNLRVMLDRPALFLRNVGAERDPWRGPGRPRDTLRGAPAARIVRSLVDFTPPYTIKQVEERSGASTGATYRVIDFLEREGLVERRPRGPVTGVAWRRLIERLSRDYSFSDRDVVRSYLFPRGVEAVPEALRSSEGEGYVLTGSLAAQHYAPYAAPRLAMIYVADLIAMADVLGLRPVDRGANVLLAAGSGDVSSLRARSIEGVRTAAPSQIAVDLLTAPGRAPSEGKALLDWMESNEPTWRQ